MRKTYLIITTLLLCLSSMAQTKAVGIGTTNPQQKLHLDKTVGTVRIESLDKNNNTRNGGNLQPTGTYPLYVDANGVLTLDLQTLYNSDGADAYDNLTIPSSTVNLLGSDTDGKTETTFTTYTLTVTQPRVLEVKYSISFEVYFNNTLTKIKDAGARRISTFYTLDGGTRRYGQASRSYMSNNLVITAPAVSTDILAAAGPGYNSTTTYIQLSPGTHTLQFKAEVSSNLPSLPTYVKLAVDFDSIFMRLY